MGSSEIEGRNGQESGCEAKCPECDCRLAHRSGCVECPACGFAICVD